MDDFLPLLEAQHATFSPITMSWSGNGEVDLGSWVQTINYPEGPGKQCCYCNPSLVHLECNQ